MSPTSLQNLGSSSPIFSTDVLFMETSSITGENVEQVSRDDRIVRGPKLTVSLCSPSSYWRGQSFSLSSQGSWTPTRRARESRTESAHFGG